MNPKFDISAYSLAINARVHIFTWHGPNGEEGIDKAKEDATAFGWPHLLTDYQATPSKETTP